MCAFPGKGTTKTNRKDQPMANQPDIKNVQRGLRVERELDAKVLKKFRLDESMTVKDAYILALQFATKDIELTAEDNEKIAADKRAAKNAVRNHNRKGTSK